MKKHPVESPGRSEQGVRRLQTWLKRIGFAGFLFFLIKGLLWLLVPYIITHWFAS